jgi:hypothetical protein
MVSVLVRNSFVTQEKPGAFLENNGISCPQLVQRRVSFTCTDLKPVGNARIDSRYKLDTVIEDVDGLIGLQCRLSQTLAVHSGNGESVLSYQ